MDIYILRDGKETGPFSEETTKRLLQEGSLSEADLAWHSGLPKWLPLAGALNPLPPALETPPPPPPEAAKTALPTFSTTGLGMQAVELATPKQKALLSYLGLPFSPDLSKDQAALFINEAMEDSKKAGRFAQWNTERLTLHPDLFEAEIQQQKEARTADYLEICQTTGAEYFTKITRAHCQVVVSYLDGKFPDWDSVPKEAPRKYFFPAVAEKFPQLVAKAWQGKLRYGTEPKPAPEEAKPRPAASRPGRKKAPQKFSVAMLTRGLVFAVILLGMYWFVRKLSAPGDQKPPPMPGPTIVSPAPIPPVDPLAPAPAPPHGEANPVIDPGKKEVAPIDPFAPAPAVPVEPADPAKPPEDPKMATDPAAPKPAEPLPGFPPDPLAPAPAPVPGAIDPLSPVPPATPVDPPVVAKSVLKLTKVVDVQLAYGKMKLPVGTPVKFVSREGGTVKVSYLNTILTLPVTSTDFGVPEVVPAPAPGPGAAPAPGSAPAPPPASPAPAMAPKSDL